VKEQLRAVWKELRRDRWAVASGLFLILVFVSALVAPWLAPQNPNQTALDQRLGPVGTSGHLLGTDEVGRDILSRLLYGGRVTLMIGFAAVLLAMVVGVILGLASGFYGGIFDFVVMRVIDVLMSFPSILLAIAVIAMLGPGIFKAMIAVSIVGIPYYARIARSSALSLREQEFVEAARSSGATDWRLVIQHIMPNSAAPIIVAATLDVGWMIMAAAGLSFLGLGAQPPTAEWGLMLSQGRNYIAVAPHVSVLPGLAIFCVVLALNLLGDGLRDALDPRLHGRHSGE